MSSPLPRTPAPDQRIGSMDHTRWTTALGRAVATLVTRTTSWAQANVVLAVTLVVSLGVFLGATALAGEIYESVMEADDIAVWDRPLQAWVLTIRTPALDSAVAFYSNTGGPVLQPIITGLIVLFLCWRWRSRTPLVLTLVAAAGSLLMTVVGKNLVGRARPPLAEAIPPFEHSPSFPSGHTLNATVIAGIVCYLMLHWFRTQGVRTLWVVLMATYAITMGLSRVYLGHHWLTDVLVGFLLGLAWLAVVITLHRLWLTARAKHGEPRWNAMLRPPPEPDP